MRKISYSKFSEEDLGIELEDLLRALSDYLLQSGYQDPYLRFSEMNQHTLEELKNAIQRALESGDLFDPEQAEEMRQRLQQMSAEQRDRTLKRLIEKLEQAGYIRTEENENQPTSTGAGSGPEGEVRFDVTDKAIDFLGFKTLKDLLGSLGKSSFGAHDTRDLATGIDASGGAKAYEFGDTLNLDISATLLSAMQRE
jgi:Ca-activated chloride channel homolog